MTASRIVRLVPSLKEQDTIRERQQAVEGNCLAASKRHVGLEGVEAPCGTLFNVIEESPDEVVLALSLRSELEAPVARLRSDELHRPLDRAVKTSSLDRHARPSLLAFDIEKTALKVDHQRPLMAE